MHKIVKNVLKTLLKDVDSESFCGVNFGVNATISTFPCLLSFAVDFLLIGEVEVEMELVIPETDLLLGDFAVDRFGVGLLLAGTDSVEGNCFFGDDGEPVRLDFDGELLLPAASLFFGLPLRD